MKKNILLVEDDPVMRWILERFIKKQNEFRFTIKSNGIEAIKWLNEGNLPDLIVTDHLMPIMNGIELAEALHNSGMYNDIPVVMVTCVHDEEFKHTCELTGIKAVLFKPFDPERLINLMGMYTIDKNKLFVLNY